MLSLETVEVGGSNIVLRAEEARKGILELVSKNPI